MNSTFKTDVAIIGGGPGGAASAIFLAEKGLKSIIIEKEAFPRFHIGESMTGECGNLVRRLGLSEAMDQVPRTIKPGVIVYGKSGKNTFHIPVMRRNEAGELEQSFTWQVRRGEFDKMLLDKAQENGASILRGKAVKVLTDETGTPCGVQVRQEDGQLTDVLAEVLIDASGPATFLHTEGFTSERERGKYDRQIAIYTHVKGATRDEEDHTRIFYEMRNHWAWFIPIDEETVSIGVVTPSDYYRDSKEDLREFFLREIHKINPQLSLRVPDVSLVEEVRATSNYSYHIRKFTGKGFLCVGDSHRFIDPIFSFGLHFALTEGKMAADAIANYLLNGVGRDVENPFAEYERYCELGMDTIQDVLDCFWDQPTPFAFMVHSRYVDDFIDLFAGRVYQEDPSPGLQAIRKVNAKLREKLQPQH